MLLLFYALPLQTILLQLLLLHTKSEHLVSPKLCILHSSSQMAHTHTHTHTRLTAFFPGLPRSASTRKVKPIWILLKQETVSGSGISWAICKSVSRSRQITTPAPHCSVFYRPDAIPATQPTASKHWRHIVHICNHNNNNKNNNNNSIYKSSNKFYKNVGV